MEDFDIDAAVDDLVAYGTSEGVSKEWDERGRGRKQKEYEAIQQTKTVGALNDLLGFWKKKVLEADPKATFNPQTKVSWVKNWGAASLWLTGNSGRGTHGDIFIDLRLVPGEMADREYKGTRMVFGDVNFPPSLQKHGLYSAGISHLLEDKSLGLNKEVAVHFSMNDSAWTSITKKLGLNWVNAEADEIQAHCGNDNAPIGTKAVGYAKPELGPFLCLNCVHSNREGNRCNHPDVVADPEMKIETGAAVIKPAACCNEFHPREKDIKAQALFRGVMIEGFSKPLEEFIRATMSRVPPELLTHVKEVKANPGLTPKHGRYDPETETVELSPHNFELRARLGRGPGWMHHAELTIVHEIGHSVYSFLSESQRDEWRAISGWMVGTADGQAPAYEEKRPGWPKKTSKMTHKMGVRFTRPYAEKNDDEDFADSLAFYILGKPHQMDKRKRVFLDQLMGNMVKIYPQASIKGPDKAYGERGN